MQYDKEKLPLWLINFCQEILGLEEESDFKNKKTVYAVKEKN